MRLELRHATTKDHTGRYVRDVLFIAESKAESALLDEVFGTTVNEDGLIDKRELPVECRLSDGFREHYVTLKLPEPK